MVRENPHIENVRRELEKIRSNPDKNTLNEAREKELMDFVSQLCDSYERGVKEGIRRAVSQQGVETAIELAEDLIAEGHSLDDIYCKKFINKRLSYEEVVLIEKRIKKKE